MITVQMSCATNFREAEDTEEKCGKFAKKLVVFVVSITCSFLVTPTMIGQVKNRGPIIRRV